MVPANRPRPPSGFEARDELSTDAARLADWIADCRDGWSLPAPFYSDPAVYRLDVERIWRTGWLFAVHSCEIAVPGAYVCLQIDNDPLVVVRGDDGIARSFYNVCRHRGSVVCTETSGRSSRLVCPYHQWVYGLDGSLVACRGMAEDFDRSAFGLRSVHTREAGGLIYISLADNPLPFDLANRVLSSMLRPQGLMRAKVAKAIDYRVGANWKLVWENNRECYHCNSNHPQYIKANFDHYNADDTTPRIRQQMQEAVQRSQDKWAASGLAATHTETGMTRFPDAERQIWFSANRTPLVDNFVSETMDGKQVAPLMGDYSDADVGTLRMRTLPNFWNHSSCDHSVSTRLLPLGPELTGVRVSWLVDANAVEGHDYRLEELLPFWQLTSEQDWQICERQQRGVKSTAYQPGPYSTFKEYNVNGFVNWYLKLVRRASDRQGLSG